MTLFSIAMGGGRVSCLILNVFVLRGTAVVCNVDSAKDNAGVKAPGGVRLNAFQDTDRGVQGYRKEMRVQRLSFVACLLKFGDVIRLGPG